MGAKTLHHPLSITVGVATGKPDDVDVMLAKRDGDLAGDMVGTLDKVAYDNDVSYSLSPIGPEIAPHHAEPPTSDALSVR